METILCNTTAKNLKAIAFGSHGSIGNQRTLKCRYPYSVALDILNGLSNDDLKKISIAEGKTTTQGTRMIYLAIIETYDNSIWQTFENARRNAYANELRKQADNMITYGTKKNHIDLTGYHYLQF